MPLAPLAEQAGWSSRSQDMMLSLSLTRNFDFAVKGRLLGVG